MSIAEPVRMRVGGLMESQRMGIDKLLDGIVSCVSQGDKPDEIMGIDLPPISFDRLRARELIQDFLDIRSVGKSG